MSNFRHHFLGCRNINRSSRVNGYAFNLMNEIWYIFFDVFEEHEKGNFVLTYILCNERWNFKGGITFEAYLHHMIFYKKSIYLDWYSLHLNVFIKNDWILTVFINWEFNTLMSITKCNQAQRIISCFVVKRTCETFVYTQHHHHHIIVCCT